VLERIVATITVGLIAWLDRRLSRDTTAIDADVDRDALTRAGARIRNWLRAK
jgi:hypothetical protein